MAIFVCTFLISGAVVTPDAPERHQFVLFCSHSAAGRSFALNAVRAEFLSEQTKLLD